MIRIATIGTSLITRYVARACAEADGIEVTTAYSRNAERAADFASAGGIPGSCDDLDALLASPDIDAVYVASPNSLHFEHALTCLRAGKHVLLEKPATPTAAQFETLAETARAGDVVLLEAMRNAYDPAYSVVRELLGEIGPVRRVSFAYCQRSSRYDRVLAGERVNVFDPAMAGGALLDLGVYCASALVALFGEPESVLAATVPVGSGADGAGGALAVYPGFVADLNWSKITMSDRPSEIQGERGTITIDHVAGPRRVGLRRLDGSGVEHTFPGHPTMEDIPNLRHEIERFVTLVDQHGDAGPDHARTLGTLRLVEAIGSAGDG